jgi:hypothetical protein
MVIFELKNIPFFLAVNFFQFWSLNPGSGLDPDPDRYLSQNAGSVSNEYVSETLVKTLRIHRGFPVFMVCLLRELAHEFLTRPIKVTIGSDDLAAGTRIKQIVEVVEDRARETKLFKLLKVQYHPDYSLSFSFEDGTAGFV